MKQERIIDFQKGISQNGPVIYWMSRDQRLNYNWALLYAQSQAKDKNQDLIIAFCLTDNFPGAYFRHYSFMLEGLEKVQTDAAKYNIPFKLLIGLPQIEIPKFIKEINASALITDFDPLKIKRFWKNEIKSKISIPYFEIDAHNIVPISSASNKLEFSAATLRPKINKQLDYFLDDFDDLEFHNQNSTYDFPKFNTNEILNNLRIDNSVGRPDNFQSGEAPAESNLQKFIQLKLKSYNELRNDPNYDVQSGLSPYLHFGQISAQYIAKYTRQNADVSANSESFLEELIVRRELSDNFCFYNPHYERFEGFHPWAQQSLKEHWHDIRDYIYSLEQFENAETDDSLWNAAQIELMRTAKMHGYMRMYWAKKILEWSENPQTAQDIAIYLNDKYSLDGRDPNGYTGIAWSIGGVHDRAWTERAVYGKIRYMNRNGCARKFDINRYIQKFSSYSRLF